MSTVDVVVPEPGNEPAAKALSALIHSLYELDQVGIVRYVSRKDAVPKFGYLFPRMSPTLSRCLGHRELSFNFLLLALLCRHFCFG
jgi:hypothetical protein